jgi:uncharacterized membrane protein YkvA (DUF1232 family)
MSGVLGIVLAAAFGLALAWASLAVALVLGRPRGGLLGEAVRLLPDTVRLLKNLATDAALPRGVRARLWLLFAYLATPVDLIPDFLPVIGYADDAILVAMVLRSVVRRAGLEALRRHWSGTDDGFRALCRVAGVPTGAGS